MLIKVRLSCSRLFAARLTPFIAPLERKDANSKIVCVVSRIVDTGLFTFLGLSLICFFFYRLCFLEMLNFFTDYAQNYARFMPVNFARESI